MCVNVKCSFCGNKWNVGLPFGARWIGWEPAKPPLPDARHDLREQLELP